MRTNYLNISGSVDITGSVTIKDLALNSLTRLVVIDSADGKLYYSNTASYATNALSASYASGSTSASFAATAASAPLYVLNSATSSFVQNSQTSSFVQNSQTGSFVTNPQTSSFVQNSQTSSMSVLSASYASGSTSASFASTAASAPLYTLNSATSSMLAPYVLNSQTSSFVQNSQTSSFVTNAQTASMTVASASHALTASSANNFLVRGTLTAQTIVAQTITSSTDFVTGSTRFGSLLINTHQFTGSVSITGSLNVTGAGITGSLFGTASWANNATSASYALNATSASYALSASFASQAANATSASYALNATSASYALNATSASFAPTATNVFLQGGNSFGTTALLGTNDVQDLQFETNGTVRMTISGSNGNVGIGTTSPSYKLDVAGTFGVSGDATFNGTNTYINSSNIAVGNNSTDVVGISGNTMYFPGNGNVGIGTISPSSTLTVSGSISGSGDVYFKGLTTTNQSNVVTINTATGQLYYTASSAFGGGGGGNAFPYTGSAQITGSLGVTGSVSVSGSTGTVFFSNADTMTFTGSIFQTGSTVISGSLSVTDSITIGGSQTYYAIALSSTSPSTASIFTNNTGSFTSAFYKYTVYSGSNARAGQISAVWASNSIQYNDYSTIDIGSTLAVTASVAIVTGQVQLNVAVPASSTGWNVKATVTYL